MPDVHAMGLAFESAALASAFLVALLGWPWNSASRMSASGALGVGLGTLVGASLLGLASRLSPQEPLDRLLLLLLPAAVAAEVLAAVWNRAGWALRLAVSGLAAPILLDGSSYVSDLNGPGSREWSQADAWSILSGLTLALFLEWALLVRLAAVAPGRAVGSCLALVSFGAGATVMLSGYATGGMLAFPLAGAILGSMFFTSRSSHAGSVGVSVVTLFGLLLIGRLFAGLTTLNAALLFAAPLLAWLPELPVIRRWGARWRAGLRLALTSLPVAAALFLAQQKFEADSASSKPDSKESSLEDYAGYGP